MRISRRQFVYGALAGSRALAARSSLQPTLLSFDGDSEPARMRIDNNMQASALLNLRRDDVLEYMQLLQSPPMRSSASRIDDLSRSLFNALWQPIGKVGMDKTPVLIRATGILKNFPFESLRGATYVGQSFRIHYLVKTDQPRAGQQMGPLRIGVRLVYAPFRGRGTELPRIRATQEEARMVAKQMKCGMRIGQEASATRLRKDLASPFVLLHIASHADSIRGTSVDQAIALRCDSDAEAVEWLTASEVRRMRLRGRLIVLSACGAPSRDGSSDTLSLPDSFVMAGVTEAIGARWVVDDSATLEFMRVLYGWLGHNRDTAIALRNARGGLIGGTFLPYQSPYFWASFASFIADPFPP